VHGYTHDRPDSFELEREEEELVKAKKILERFSGENIHASRSAAWEHCENMLSPVKKHGFDFACDAIDEDVPY
jgi:peptidoglycan/xylan/chitin deacetylase (PgdA/CDA1 family)